MPGTSSTFGYDVSLTAVAFVTVPFGVITQTSFMAERAIGYVVSVGLKMMALGVILGVGINIFKTFTLSPEPTIGEECGLLLSAIFLAAALLVVLSPVLLPAAALVDVLRRLRGGPAVALRLCGMAGGYLLGEVIGILWLSALWLRSLTLPPAERRGCCSAACHEAGLHQHLPAAVEHGCSRRGRWARAR